MSYGNVSTSLVLAMMVAFVIGFASPGWASRQSSATLLADLLGTYFEKVEDNQHRLQDKLLSTYPIVERACRELAHELDKVRRVNGQLESRVRLLESRLDEALEKIESERLCAASAPASPRPQGLEPEAPMAALSVLEPVTPMEAPLILLSLASKPVPGPPTISASPPAPVPGPRHEGPASRAFEHRSSLSMAVARAESRVKAGRLSEAAADLSKALAPYEADDAPAGDIRLLAKAFASLGRVYRKLKQREKAIVKFRRSLALIPEDASVLNTLAWSLLRRRNRSVADREEALKLARRAVDHSPVRVANYLDTYALALFANGWHDRAVQVQKEAVTLDRRRRRTFCRRLETYRAKVAERMRAEALPAGDAGRSSQPLGLRGQCHPSATPSKTLGRFQGAGCWRKKLSRPTPSGTVRRERARMPTAVIF